jgi:hypothetical protein
MPPCRHRHVKRCTCTEVAISGPKVQFQPWNWPIKICDWNTIEVPFALRRSWPHGPQSRNGCLRRDWLGANTAPFSHQRRIDFSDHDRPGWGREGLGRENAIFHGKVPGTMGRGAARVIQSLRDSDCGVDRLAVWKRECTCTRQVTCSLP